MRYFFMTLSAAAVFLGLATANDSFAQKSTSSNSEVLRGSEGGSQCI